MKPRLAVQIVVVVASLSATAPVLARDLTFEERVLAQEAIERVYYSHQIGTSRSFEDAVPRTLLERKVRTYLKESVALEKFWHTPVTAAMLQGELIRLTQRTRMPERLRELYSALNADPFLIRECFARQILVARLTRNLFAYDQSLHLGSRLAAESLRDGFVRGDLDPWAEQPSRTVVDFVRSDLPTVRGPCGGTQVSRGREPDEIRVELSPDQFATWMARVPTNVGETGPLVEEREKFILRVALTRQPDELRVASFAVPKQGWQDWWTQVVSNLDERSVVAVAASDLSLPWPESSTSCTDDTWDNGSLDDTPIPREGHSAVWTGTEMIIWGAIRGATVDEDKRGARYDPATDTWAPISAVNAPSARNGHTAVWTGSAMVIWGGIFGSTYMNTGGRYEPNSDSWTTMSTTNAPEPRQSHTAIWTGGRMIVWGGYGGAGRLGTGGSYDPATDTWISISTINAPPARTGHTAVWTGSRMIVWGGDPDSTGGQYDPSADSWSSVSLLNAPSVRSGHSAVWAGSQMVVWGGYAGNGVYLNDGGRYDPVADIWRPTSLINAPSSRGGATAIWTGKEMIAWGGTNHGSLNTGGRYDPSSDTWKAVATLNAPEKRGIHSAVWTGDLMIIWGGSNDQIDLNTGGRYDPATGSWTPTSTGGAPSPRSGHRVVWTGNLMVIWGGFDGQFLTTGGRYDPMTDTWSPTSVLNAPVGRDVPTVVWTGHVMVVWGGTNSAKTAFYYTGGRYDPVADTWAPTSTSAPLGRAGHTAIWTGKVMVVWGGYAYTPQLFYLNTGGRYDPVADTWSPTSTPGAPTGRTDQAAVWTGGVMVVWGGYAGNGIYPIDGGRYDPTADTWIPTSTTGSPPGRIGPVGAWTGDRAIFWGGDVNTGGQYDPLSDTWAPTSVLNAPGAGRSLPFVWTGSEMLVFASEQTPPGARYDPLADTWRSISALGSPTGAGAPAVWTGSQMIVWGGSVSVGGIYVNTGGRYCACTPVTYFLDADGDGFGDPLVSAQSCAQSPGYVSNAADCDDTDGATWAIPSEVLGDQFVDDVTLTWSPPSAPGAAVDAYDVLRSTDSADFVGAEVCVGTRSTATSLADGATPPLGQAFFYLVRADDACPNGLGSLGTSSSGVARTGRNCP